MGKCFICGKEVIGKNGKEHVIPQWVQAKYPILKTNKLSSNGLFQESKLVFNPEFPKIKIPCCNICNNEKLCQIEDKVIDILKKGDIDKIENSLFIKIWLLKIMLANNVYDIGRGVAHSQNVAKRMDFIRKYLYKYLYENESDWLDFVKVFAFKSYDKFYYNENMASGFISIRIYGIVLILIVDGRKNDYIKNFFHGFKKIKEEILHDFQIVEIIALIISSFELLDLNLERENIFMLKILESKRNMNIAKILSYHWNIMYSDEINKKSTYNDFLLNGKAISFLGKPGHFNKMNENYVPNPFLKNL